MALLNRFFPLRTTQPNVIPIVGRVAIGASGAVGTATGTGFTVTRTAAGLYTVTLNSQGPVAAILAASASVVFATGSNTQDVKILTLDATNKKITLQTNDAGTVDSAADAPSGSILQFTIWVRNSASTG